MFQDFMGKRFGIPKSSTLTQYSKINLNLMDHA